MDRRKADLSEPGLNDLRDSSGPAQDSDVVMQLFFPFREKLATYRGYKILGENALGQIHRSVILSKKYKLKFAEYNSKIIYKIAPIIGDYNSKVGEIIENLYNKDNNEASQDLNDSESRND